MATNPEIDEYIAGIPPYAQPILRRVRAAFQRACPEVTESLKWGHASFGYRGGILAMIGAFKNHLRFRFWHSALLSDPHGFFKGNDETGPGALKVTCLAELPADEVLDAYILEAMRLQERGVTKTVRADRSPKPKLTEPPDFLVALRAQPTAEKTFAALSPSHRREYLEWILEAKREATRQQRIGTTVEYLSEGKPLHWKYGAKSKT